MFSGVISGSGDKTDPSGTSGHHKKMYGVKFIDPDNYLASYQSNEKLNGRALHLKNES